MEQGYIDKITLECMMNRQHYKQYLSKTHQHVEDEYEELERKLKTHEEKLKESLLELIYRRNLEQYSIETQELFEKLINKLVRQYENIETMESGSREPEGEELLEYENDDMY